jgi:host factor-I protein
MTLQTTEPPSTPGQSNVQDAFLGRLRRDRLPVTIRMMDGTGIEGRIMQFDRFAIIVAGAGGEQLVFKHAIAGISASTGAGGGVPSDRTR